MTTTLTRAGTTASSSPPRTWRTDRRRTAILPTVVLLVGAAYCLFPLIWLVTASTKTPGELFTTFSFLPSFSGGLEGNIAEINDLQRGVYWRWMLNSAVYAGGGAFLSTLVSAAAGYALAKFAFRGKNITFVFLLIGALVPGIMLAVPQYLLLSAVGVAGTYWSVLLPGIVSPLGIYLSRIYAEAAVPEQLLEAGRIDGATEFRIFRSLALPAMLPGLTTVFLLQFVGIWNNFLLPFIMLSDDSMFPITVGLYSWLNMGLDFKAIYNVVIVGSLLAVLPLIALFLFLQRYWRLDLATGALKG